MSEIVPHVPENGEIPRNYPANESALTRQIVEAVKKHDENVWILKTHGDGYQRPGIPDLLLCYRGYLVGVEVKHQKPGETVNHLLTRVSPAQRSELRAINDGGGYALAAWRVDQVLAALEEIDRYLPERWSA